VLDVGVSGILAKWLFDIGDHVSILKSNGCYT